MELEKYVSELRKIRLLEPEEELKLWHAYKDEGDEAARMQIIEAYQPLVFKQAMQFQKLSCIMDVIQEGTVGLIEAVESYDAGKGVAFSLFATYRVRGRIYNFLQKEGRADIACLGSSSDSGYSLLEQVPDTGIPVAEAAELHEITDRVQQAMQRLPVREQQVLQQVYVECQAVKSVAASMNISESYVYRLQQKGVRRIRGMLSRFMHSWK